MIVNDKLVTLLKAWQDQKYQDGYRAGVEAALEKVKQFSKGRTKEESASMWRDMGIAMLYDSIQALIPAEKPPYESNIVDPVEQLELGD